MRLCSRANSVWIDGQRDVLVGAHVTGDDGLVRVAHELAHQVDGRGGRGVAAAPTVRQVAVGQQERAPLSAGLPFTGPTRSHSERVASEP